MMSPRRFATSAALCGTVVLAGWVVAGLAGFGSPGIEHTDAAPIEDRPATSLTVRAVDAPRATAIREAAVSGAIVATADPPEPAVVPAAVPVAECGGRRGRLASLFADAAARNATRAGGDGEHA